jgi:methyltransferase-like protein/2-polyprenyl-3-methyl-5-hydroxy-6-metoxy-1,4-benzoquinol methylase
MNDETPNAYDEVLYPSLAHVQTHPDRLATLAKLFGMQPPPVERCSVLELGCGDGTNLISMAYALPQSRFLGIDLATRPIVEGNQTIAQLGLQNVRLERCDIADFGSDQGPFDYIIAHGVYSWVPAEVRDRLLAVCHDSLSANGVAYVSYNAYPGCHLRDMVRGMMLFHVRSLSNSAEKIAQGRALLKFLAESKKEPDLYRMMLEKELKHIMERSDGSFYHDDLSPVAHPVYLHQFVAHAAQHGLQFLGDAMFNEMQPEDYTPAVLSALEELDDDIIAREQYLDFLLCRRFRRTLLCHRDAPLDHRIRPGVIAGFYAAADVQPESSDPDLQSPVIEEFRARKGASIQTNRPLDKAALFHLSRCWPHSVRFTELLAAARRLAPSDAAGDSAGEDTKALCDLLLRAYAAGVVELHLWAPHLVTKVSDRPMASPIARLESRRGNRVTTLRHTGLELSDENSRDLLGLLDGTRDFATLVDSLADLVSAGNAQIRRGSEPVTEPAEVRAIIASELPLALERLARAALLVG